MSSDENTSTVQVKMRPMLSDMPPEIKQMIAERTDVKSRYCLRKVNTHFRAAVDKSPYYFGSLLMRRYSNCVKLVLGEDIKIKYKKNGENGCVIKRSDTTDKIIEGEDYMQRAIDDLGIMLKSPRVFAKEFGLTNFGPGAKGAEQLLAKLGTFHHQLNIRELEVNGKCDQEEVVQFLGHVTPRTLDTLHIFSFISSDISVDRIADTEQWRHLKVVTGGRAERVPIDKILHLEYFEPEEFKLTEPIIEEIVQWVRQHRDISMKYRIRGSRNYRIVKDWQNAVSQFQPSRKRIRIPGTERYLEIKLKSVGVTFQTTGGPRDPEESDVTDEDEDDTDYDSLSDSSMEYNPDDIDEVLPAVEDIDSSSDSDDSDDSDESDDSDDDVPQVANNADNGIPNDADEPAEYDASDESNASGNED